MTTTQSKGYPCTICGGLFCGEGQAYCVSCHAQVMTLASYTKCLIGVVNAPPVATRKEMAKAVAKPSSYTDAQVAQCLRDAGISMSLATIREIDRAGKASLLDSAKGIASKVLPPQPCQNDEDVP